MQPQLKKAAIVFLMVNIVFPFASPFLYVSAARGGVFSGLQSVAQAHNYTGGQCDARSKGYWTNKEGCVHDGTGASIWTSAINSLSSQYFSGAYSSIGSNQICQEMNAQCGGGNTVEVWQCKTNQFILADELNIVSGKLQLDALVAGGDDGSQSFDNLGITSTSTIVDALEAVEAIFVNPNHTVEQLKDAADVAERLYAFYENGNGQCVFSDAPRCGNGIKEGTEQCDGTAGVGAHQRCTNQCTLENLTYCSDGTVQNPNGEGKTEQCDDGNAVNGDGCTSSCKVETFCRMELIKTDSPDPVQPGELLHYHLKLTNTGTGYCTGGGVQLKEFYDTNTTFVSATPNADSGTDLWNFGEVPPGEVNEVDVTVRVSAQMHNGDILTNRACFWTQEYGQWVCVDEPTHVVVPSEQQFCGNGIKEGTEQCDGTAGVGAHQRCTNQCVLENLTYCGDGTVQNPNDEQVNEQCDEGQLNGQPNHCNAQCTGITIGVCGNNVLESSEQCDDGNIANGDGCSAQCTTENNPQPFCGDGAINQQSEQCDGTAGVGAHQRCSNQCTLDNLTYCGDTILQSLNDEGIYEQCDGTDGVGAFQVCSLQCTLTNLDHCGDGVVNASEQCDDGNIVSGDGCSAQCLDESTGGSQPFCGDGVKNQHSEECDGLAGIGANQRCSTQCTLENLTYCGDGTMQRPNQEATGGPSNDGNEQCDGTDGTGQHQSCSASCVLSDVPYCGDGIKNNDEQCDAADFGQLTCSSFEFNSGQLSCTESCTITTQQCQTTSTSGPVCGNGALETGEQCDDGNLNNTDSCNNSCVPQSATTGGGGGGGGGGYFFLNPRLIIDKTVNKKVAEVGETLTYTVVITNIGNAVGQNLTLEDTLPDGLRFTGNGQTKHWDLPPIGPTNSQTITYTVEVNEDAQTGRYINRAVAALNNASFVEDREAVDVLSPRVLGIEAPAETPTAPVFKTIPNTSGINVTLWLQVMTYVFMSTSVASLLYIHLTTPEVEDDYEALLS